jgi:hypothetical protein
MPALYWIVPFVCMVNLVWAIFRYRQKTTLWRALTVIGMTLLVIASPFLMFLGVLAADEFREHRNRLSFESAEWKASLARPNDPVRLRMIDDLLKHKRLQGMAEEEVISLLGKPPKTDYFRDYQLVYWLGPERGFISIDSEWLAVRLGSDHRVTETRIVRD